MRLINTCNESPLHESVKRLYVEEGDHTEVSVKGYLVDVLKRDSIVEVQTANFSAIKKKLAILKNQWNILLVFPVIEKKSIRKFDQQGREIYKRKSPKKSTGFDVFQELLYISELFLDPPIQLELVFIEAEEDHCDDGKGSWRRNGVSIRNRRLVSVLSKKRFENKEDYKKFLQIIPGELFTTAVLRERLQVTKPLAIKIAYFLRHSGISELVGKQARHNLFRCT